MSISAAPPAYRARTTEAWFILLAVAFFALVTAQVLVEIYLDCVGYYDLGIYSEGILRLGFATINPWLSARHLTLFSDHFDPVVFLAGPFVRGLPLPYGAAVFEALVVFCGCLPFYLLVRRRALSPRNACLLASLVLFNAGVTTAVHEPIHPTTWAMTPWLFMVVALERKKLGHVLVWFIALMACKEEFPFVGFALAAVLFVQHKRRHACGFALLSAAWLTFVYGVRPHLVGEVMPYYGVPFAGLDRGFVSYLTARLSHPDLVQHVPRYLLPLLPLAIWSRRTARTWPNVAYLFLLAPTLGLRFLTMQWRHQYHAVTLAALTVAFLPALRRAQVPRSLVALTCALLALVNVNHVKDALAFAHILPAPEVAYCEATPGRLDALARGRALVRAQPPGRLLVGMNLLAKLVDLPNTFVLDMPDPLHRVPYDVVFFEHPPHGADWPLTPDRQRALIERWRTSPGVQILLDDVHVFVAAGKFFDT